MTILASARLSCPQGLGIKGVNSDPLLSEAFSSPKLLNPSQLTEKLRRLQPNGSSRRCGSWIGRGATFSVFGNGEAGFTGHRASCRSPRCPRCRVVLMSRRKDEIQAVIDWWVARSPIHQVSMLTLTAPHLGHQSLARFLGSTSSRSGLSGAVSLLKQRKLWKTDVSEYISGQEATHGRNGWHVHYHILIFHTRQLDLDAWFSAWSRACVDSGLSRPSRAHGVTLQPAESAASYLAKWGIASENVGAHVKDAKHGNRSLAQIEHHAAAGDVSSQQLLKIYYRNTKRRRVHTFSRGLSLPRLRHTLNDGLVSIAHYSLDISSSYTLYKDQDLSKVLISAIVDCKSISAVLQAVGLKGIPIQNPGQKHYPSHFLKSILTNIGNSKKYPDTYKNFLDLIISKKSNCLPIQSNIDFLLQEQVQRPAGAAPPG